MNEKIYITIGTPTISKDIFRNILRPLNNYNFKPTGGLWASEYNLPYARICPWFDYLLDAKSLVLYISEHRDLSTASMFTLKEDANILVINDISQILTLAAKYPSYHHLLNYYNEINEEATIFDMEEIAKIYDGIYVDYQKLIISGKTKVFDSFSINTLLLFNLDCIKEYQPVHINVNFYDYYPIPYIDVKKDIGASKLIIDKTIIYNEIYNYVRVLLNELIAKNAHTIFNSYDEYLENIISCANTALEIAKVNKEKEIKIIKEALKEEGLIIEEIVIIRNIVLNYLSNYLYAEKEKIITLPKSLIKQTKSYPI